MRDIYVANKQTSPKKASTDDQSGELMPHRDPKEYSEVVRNQPKSTNPLSAFILTPKAFSFDAQEKEEQVVLLLRKHFITNVPWIMLSLVMLLVPLALVFVPALIVLPTTFQFVIVLSWYLMIFGLSLENFMSWYFHVFIITDERIIDYDFHSLLHKRVSKAKIDRIEDITYETGGFLPSVLNYGTVYIQTAGEMREFDFEDVPQPDLVVKLLNELILEEEKESLEGRAN